MVVDATLSVQLESDEATEKLQFASKHDVPVDPPPTSIAPFVSGLIDLVLVFLNQGNVSLSMYIVQEDLRS